MTLLPSNSFSVFAGGFDCGSPFTVHAHRDRALSALCGDRHPVGPRLPDLPFHRKAKRPGPPARRRAAGDGTSRRPSRRTRLRLRDDPGQYRQTGPGHLLLLAYGHLARLHRQGRQAADRKELSRRRHRAAGRPHAGDPRRGSSRAQRPDRQRHRHHGRHHAVGRRQQGRPRRNHGCRAFPDRQSADQARRHQDPVHARRRDRPRRRQGRPEEARRRFCLHDRRRNRREYRGRDLFRRWRHHHHRRRQHPSRLRQGQDGARDQDRRRHRRSAAQEYLFAGNHRGQGRLSASDRHFRRAGESHAQFHRARFHRRGIEREGSPAGRHRQRGDEGLSALDLPAGDQASSTAT